MKYNIKNWKQITINPRERNYISGTQRIRVLIAAGHEKGVWVDETWNVERVKSSSRSRISRTHRHKPYFVTVRQSRCMTGRCNAWWSIEVKQPSFTTLFTYSRILGFAENFCRGLTCPRKIVYSINLPRALCKFFFFFWRKKIIESRKLASYGEFNRVRVYEFVLYEFLERGTATQSRDRDDTG